MNRRRWYSPLVQSAACIAGIGILEKIFQLLVGVLFAHKFGASQATDAYMLAKSLPIGIYLVADSLLYNSLVPIYRRQENPTVLRGFLGAVCVLLMVSTLATMTVLFIHAPRIFELLAPGSAPETTALAGSLCRLMSVAVIAIVPASLLKALNARHGRYVLAALDTVVMHGVLILAILAPPARWGLWPLAGALPSACLILLFVQVIAVRRDIELGRPEWRSPLLRSMMILIVPLIAFNGLHQVNVLAMNAFMSYAGRGAISWLSFSYNVAQVPVSLVGLLLLSTLFPFAVTLSSSGDTRTFRQAYHNVARWLVLVLFPVSVWIILSRQGLIELVFQRGRFNETAAGGTASCLLGIGFAITPWAFETFAYRCLFALRLHWRYTWIVALRIGINAALCALLVHRLGELGVALSFAASFLVGAYLAAHTLRGAIGMPASERPMLNALGPASLAGAAVGTTVWGLEPLFQPLPLPLQLIGSGVACAVVVGLVYGTLYILFATRERTRSGE